MPDSGDLSVSGQSISLINDVLSENKFGITPTGTAIGKERLKIFKKAGDAKIQANAGQQRLINEFSDKHDPCGYGRGTVYICDSRYEPKGGFVCKA